MDGRPVSPATPASEGGSRPNWKLAEPINALTQGIVASGFGHLPFGRALLLDFVWEDAAEDGAKGGTKGGSWLHALDAEVEITHGAPMEKGSRAAILAFTWTGLKRMRLDDRALASFSRPFREGMFQEDRLRRLGDRRTDYWLDTVIGGGPRWSGNVPLRNPSQQDPEWVSATSVPHLHKEQDIRTPLTVHALLLLYTGTEAEAEAWSGRVKALLRGVGVETVRELDLHLDIEKQGGFSREHFGFADALSQPIPYGLPIPEDESGLVTLAGVPAQRDPIQGVPLGEILLGYQNGYSEPAPGPLVSQSHDDGPDKGKEDARVVAAGLEPHPLAEGFADLGINGSYLVVRELKQDVAMFWNSFDANAAQLKAKDPSIGPVDAEWLAERAVGRDLDGHLLRPGGGVLPARPDGTPDSDFLFRERDPKGLGCPLGSHVRRSFPRDGLAPDPSRDSRDTLLQSANNHRVLRRGRKYGEKIADKRVDDGADRGLLFMCLNTDIERQFEFTQQTWLLNTTFSTLYGESDPLVGPSGHFTIPQEPLRRRVPVQTYVQFSGGEYFFLPSMPALAYLRQL
ncbi:MULTISPECIES: hypothetical protein [Methylobacterium]|uniref:hypothetical protein n=1 Tax=Methylobacterium TaxID=407 RepID=UPI0013EB1BD3|nr:hypothetical protein [Methylobacterium sp. DB0501]NGM35349.1 hypothetical protein [Methylobacterium sp. DB0501]